MSEVEKFTFPEWRNPDFHPEFNFLKFRTDPE